MTKRDAKKMQPAQLRQLQLLLGWKNEEAAKILGVSLKTFVNWRSGASRIPHFLEAALNYHIHLQNVEYLSRKEQSDES